MRRSKEDVHQLNRIYCSQRNSQLQLTVNPAQLASLSSKAPDPITTMSELLPFLKQAWHFSTFFFPLCAFGQLAKDIYTALLTQRRYLANDPEWLSLKPGEIIFFLKLAQDKEFNHVIPASQLLQSDLTSAYQPPPTTFIVNQCLSPAPSFTQGFLPMELRRRTTPVAPPATISHTNPSGNTSRNTGGGTRAGRGGANQRENQRDRGGGVNQDQVHTNPQHHQHFKTFWTSVPEQRQRDPIRKWLEKANSSTNKILDTLGLDSHDCGHYHLRGKCNQPLARSCNNRHQPKTLAGDKVDSVIAILQSGMQQMS